MKTSEALFEALESVLRVKEAMYSDIDSSDTKPAGARWIKRHYSAVSEAYELLEGVLESLDDQEGG